MYIISQEELDEEVSALLEDKKIRQLDGPTMHSFFHNGDWYNYSAIHLSRSGLSIGRYLLEIRRMLEDNVGKDLIVWRLRPIIETGQDWDGVRFTPYTQIRGRYVMMNKDRYWGIEQTIEEYKRKNVQEVQEIAVPA